MVSYKQIKVFLLNHFLFPNESYPTPSNVAMLKRYRERSGIAVIARIKLACATSASAQIHVHETLDQFDICAIVSFYLKMNSIL